MKNAIKIRLLSIAALLIIAFAAAPSSVKADFWDDFVDFLNPVKRVENIIDGRPQDNLIPPLPTPVEIIDPFCLFACDNKDNQQVAAQNQNPPTLSFWAAPTVVSYNGSSVLTWNSTNSQLCSASGGTNGWSGRNRSPSGTFHTGGLTSTTTFHIKCGNTAGSASGSVTIVVTNPPPTPTCQDTTATNYGGALPCVYPVQVCQNPTASNYGGQLPCTFPQQLAPTVNISTNPSNIGYNGSTTINWNSSNATSCFGSGGTIGWSGNKNTSGSFFVGSLTGSTTFHILCSNSAGSTSRSATVHVGNNNNTNSVSVNITADDTRLYYGGSTRIRWNSINASYCTASGGTNGWSGYQNTSGSFNTGSMTSDKTFRITCYNNQDSSNDSISIMIDDYRYYQPEITTANATSIGTTSATLNGRIANGPSTRTWFEYGTNTNFGYTTTKSSYSSNSTNFSKSISGLMPNTTYYFRAVAENSATRVYGNILTFRTTGNFVPATNTQPTVIVYADHASISYNGATTIRWSTANASSCFASGGSTGWAGAKSVGSGFFYTGVMTSSKTFTLTCSNAFGYRSNSVTVSVKQKTSAAAAPAKPSVSPSSMVLIASSVERNQVGAPTLDNALRAGDEINYLVSYQNVGTASISGLTLRVDLDRQTYFISSNPENSNKLGNIVIFNLGTLKANEQGTVVVRALIQPNIAADTNLNFTATLSYIDPSKAPKSVTTNASAQIVGPAIFPGVTDEEIDPQANAIGAGFLPTDIFGWFILFILVLVLILLSRHLYGQFAAKKTVYIEDHHHV